MSNPGTTSKPTIEGFPTTNIVSFSGGSLAVPCEPVAEGLAITPCLDLGEDRPLLGGGFVVTHTPTGRLVGAGQTCLECAREIGRRLAATGVAWAGLDVGDADKFKAGVGEHRPAVIAALRLSQKCQQQMCFIADDDEPCGACGMVRQHAHYCMHVVVPMVVELNAAEAVAER
jgi:hypothetical protein